MWKIEGEPSFQRALTVHRSTHGAVKITIWIENSNYDYIKEGNGNFYNQYQYSVEFSVLIV